MKGANVQGWEISTRKPIRLRTLNRHERKRLSVTHQGRLCARPAVSRNAIPHNGRLTRTSPSSSRKAVWPARAARLPDTGGAATRGADARACRRSHAGQVTDHIPNTPGNSRAHPPRSCYSYCMISPIRGNRTGFRVQVPPRTPERQVKDPLHNPAAARRGHAGVAAWTGVRDDESPGFPTLLAAPVQAISGKDSQRVIPDVPFPFGPDTLHDA
jgi:hypothetical protein